MLSPHNRNHQLVFLAILVELKRAADKFLGLLKAVAAKYGLSRRVFEAVRAKMWRLCFATVKLVLVFTPE